MTLPKYFHFGVQQLLLQFYLFPISIIQSYDDSLGLSQNCKDHCDKHRGGGWSLEYEFNCDEIYHSNPSEKNLCRSSCQLCPDSVCNSKTPNIFKCPMTDIDGDCKKRCDSKREYASLHGIVINCTTAYDTSSEVEDCKQDCGQCPDWVCNDQIDSYTFYCPIGTYDGKCREICERYDQQNIGITVDLTRHFRCDQEPRWKDECTLTCVDCPVMVCDHSPQQLVLILSTLGLFVTPTLSYDSTLRMSQTCKDRCDKNRPPGNADRYILYCDQVTSDPTEQANCQNDCQHCPGFICSSSYPNIFHCPETNRGWEDCGYACDDNQPDDILQSFTFRCSDIYDDDDDVSWCQEACNSTCPSWVCDRIKDNNTFHCPPTYSGLCKRDCDYHRTRKHGYGYRGAFQFTCDEFYGQDQTNCESACDNCPHDICEWWDNNTFSCPSVEGDLFVSTTTEEVITSTTEEGFSTTEDTSITKPGKTKEYEGVCKTRCDKFRLGGNGTYDLFCDKLFLPMSEELAFCQRDCEYCPDDICVKDSKNNHFMCPAKDHEVQDSKEKEPEDKTSVALIDSIFFAVLMTIFFIVMTILYCKSKKRLAEVTPLQEQPLQQQVQPLQRQQQVPLQRQQQMPLQRQQQVPLQVQSYGQGLNQVYFDYWTPPPPLPPPPPAQSPRPLPVQSQSSASSSRSTVNPKTDSDQKIKHGRKPNRKKSIRFEDDDDEEDTAEAEE